MKPLIFTKFKTDPLQSGVMYEVKGLTMKTLSQLLSFLSYLLNFSLNQCQNKELDTKDNRRLKKCSFDETADNEEKVCPATDRPYPLRQKDLFKSQGSFNPTRP